MNPKHSNPTAKRQDRDGNEFWAHAPYNFVPLPEKVVIYEEYKDDIHKKDIPRNDAYTGLTGYLECLLETRSPLYTRCAMDPEFFRQWGDKSFHELSDEQKNELARFFSLDDAQSPVIPGSSLRGMVRALVEIVSFSKVQPVTNQHLVYRAVGDTSSLGIGYRKRLLLEVGHNTYEFGMLAGYMHKHGASWEIIPAQPINGAAFARIEQSDIPNSLTVWHNARNAYRIYVSLAPLTLYSHARGRVRLRYVKVVEANPDASPGLQETTLVKTGRIGRKHQEFVFGLPEIDPQKFIPVDRDPLGQDLVDAYKEQLTDSQKELLGDEGVLQDWQPIFYSMDQGKLIFFGHAMMFRLPYPNSPENFLPELLKEGATTDLAEAVFGYVETIKSEARPQARAGRVFFSNAELESEDDPWLSDDPITPKVLGSPKPTTFQHYLVQDKKNHDPDVEQQLAHYATPIQETAIRGHKLYWHRNNVTIDEIKEHPEKIIRAPKQYTRMKPVKTGVTFRFRIYVENLHDFELGALLWVLTLPGEVGKDYCHSLGMGKPLGMGAVKISPILYLGDRMSRYKKLFSGEDWQRNEQVEFNTQKYIRIFEEFVMMRMDDRERAQAKSLREVERIKMLLKMLEWPGPNHSLTEYMTIDPVNEYRKRPVLPDPLNIDKKLSSRRSTEKRHGSDERGYRRDNRRRW